VKRKAKSRRLPPHHGARIRTSCLPAVAHGLRRRNRSVAAPPRQTVVSGALPRPADRAGALRQHYARVRRSEVVEVAARAPQFAPARAFMSLLPLSRHNDLVQSPSRGDSVNRILRRRRAASGWALRRHLPLDAASGTVATNDPRVSGRLPALARRIPAWARARQVDCCSALRHGFSRARCA
jgi:hypothetical protein